jgi:hypothetical protein
MPDNDAFADRRRAAEEDFFQKRDREILENMRKAAAAERRRTEMGAAIGVADAETLRELEELGFTPDTIVLLPLVPVVQVAWAEGGVSTAERDLLVQLARSRGIAEGSAADQQLSQWLTRPPDSRVFAGATRLVRAMLDANPPAQGDLDADALVRYCEKIAEASGGFLGLNRISSEERALLATVATALKSRG